MDRKKMEVRRQVAECVRQLLSGRISCDHVMEEFGSSDDRAVSEIIQVIANEAARVGRYKKLDGPDQAFREKIEKMIQRLQVS